MWVDTVDARNDEELLEDHLAGADGAFAALVDRHMDELYAFLYRFVGNPAAADDLVQETFLQVHLSARSFDRSRAFRPWLYTIAANKARDYLRTRGRRQHASIDTPGFGDESAVPAQTIASGDPPQSDQIEADETRERVRRLVDAMPEHLRAILMLGYYQQLPYAEIAEILGIPVGTVKSRLHAAVTHFARLWRDQVGTNTVAK